MPTKKINLELVEHVAQITFDVLPLLRKKLLRVDLIQNEHEMPLSHVQVLAMMGETGALSVSEISKRLGIAKPNITPLVDRLMEMGYVERVRDDVDRRVVNIVLLPAGYEKLAAIRETIVGSILEWASLLPEKEFADLDAALATIVSVLSKATTKEGK